MDYNKIWDEIKTPKRILITMHARPDADALGSSLALAGILKKIGHKVDVIAPTEFPNFLDWFKDSNEVHIYTKDKQLCNEIIDKVDLIFCLDFTPFNRLEGMEEIISSSNATKIIIDHHIDAENLDKIKIWDPKASATAILIYRLISNLGLLKYLDADIADCLYSGILTDTGSFQHPTTNVETHLVTAELIKNGANVSETSKKIFNTCSINRLKFLGFAITNRLKILEEYHTAYFVIKKKDWDFYNLKTGDTEGLVNYALSLENIFFGALISDQGNFIRISLRSKGDVPANEIAKKIFDGGGHKNAAGGKSFDSLNETITKFENAIVESKIYNFKNYIDK